MGERLRFGSAQYSQIPIAERLTGRLAGSAGQPRWTTPRRLVHGLGRSYFGAAMRVKPMIRAGLSALLAMALLAGLAQAARADEITDQIGRALAAYRQNDLIAALAALDTAANLLRQAREDAWKTMLPAPLPGWDAKPAEVMRLGGLVLGGGTGVSRAYTKGGDSVQISVLADSPMLQGIAGAIGGVLGSGLAGRVSTIAGQSVTYLAADNSYLALLAGKVVVRVEGSRGVDEPTLRQYLSGIDCAGSGGASGGVVDVWPHLPCVWRCRGLPAGKHCGRSAISS